MNIIDLWRGVSTYRRKPLLNLALVAIAMTMVITCAAEEDGEIQTSPDQTFESGGASVEAGDSSGVGDSDGVEVFSVGYTYGNRSGNRYFPGKGRLSSAGSASQPIRIDVGEVIDTPMWLTAAAHPDGGAVWVVTGASGKSVAHRIGRDDVPTEVAVDVSPQDSSLVPPVLVIGKSGQARLTTTREVDGLATLLPGVSVEFVDDPPGNGDLRVTNGEITAVTSLQNAPDATFVIGDELAAYSYADSTDRYPHGAIGDRYEWGGIWAVPLDDVTGASHALLRESEVFEGLYPILADIDEDGIQDVIATVSDRAGGARLVAMKPTETGLKTVGISEPIGTGFRWTHQLAVAPFGPGGKMELATIKTPHIGGVAEFYSLGGGSLNLVASLAGGYSSHVNGSRNLDMAFAADFDGDGNVELLVPSRDRRTLVALRRTGEGVEEAWKLSLGSPLETNVAAVQLTYGSDDLIAIGVVTADRKLIIWQ